MNYRSIFLAIGLFLIGQTIVWIQVNGPVLWDWAQRWRWALMFLGVPITWLFMEATRNAIEGYGGEFWPGRFLSFVSGIIIFAILTYIFKGEGITLKTSVSLALAVLLLSIQLFWK